MGFFSKMSTRNYALNTLKIDASKGHIFWTMVFFAMPTIIEHLLETIVQYIDTAMVGQIGAKATTVVGLSTSLNWLVNSPLFAIGIGFLAMVSKSLGDGNTRDMKRAANQAIIFVVVFGLFEGAVTLLLSPFIPRWMGADRRLWFDASQYFAVICLPMVFRAAIIIFGSLLRAIGNTKTPLRINFFINIVNIILNMVLIYPSRTMNLGATAFTLPGMGMGTLGAGIATAVAFTLGGVLMWLAFKREPMLYGGFRAIRLHKQTMHQSIKMSLPIAMNKVATSLGYVVFAGLVSSMGTLFFAAHSIAIVAESIFYVPAYGMQSATSAMIGYTVGKKNWNLYKRTLTLNLIFIMMIMCPLSAILFFYALPVMQFFTNDAYVIALGVSVLKIVAFSEPFFGLSIVLEGAYHGLGMTKYPFAVETSCMWFVRIAGSFLALKIGHVSLAFIWILMVADNMTKTALFCVGLLYRKRRRKIFEQALVLS